MPNIIEGRFLKYISPALGEVKIPNAANYQIGSVKQVTHDGDTIKVSVSGNFSVRFLGIDTPEISFELKGKNGFHHIGSINWINYLNDLRNTWTNIKQVLGIGLFNNISQKLDLGDVAINHSIHAKRAEDKLESLIEADIQFLGLDKNNMRFFLPFAYEILDGYGRLLSFVHPDLKNEAINIQNKPDRIASYNDRMLESGFSLPYFIWPNINPFRKESNVVAAVYNSPQELRSKIASDNTFGQARQHVKNSRASHTGVFEPDFHFEGNQTGTLILEAFELRFLGRQSAPSRYFINLESDDNVLHKPTDYYQYYPEDRLFIPQEFIPLFESKGWVAAQ